MIAPCSEEIIAAHERIKKYVHRTPILTSTSLNRIYSSELYFKCENFQKVGAFKFRGACNAVLQISEKDASRGVATHSSGNHAAALALAARTRGIPAYVVMPNNSPQIKINAVEGYGAKITFCEPNLKAREDELAKVIQNTGAHFVHPYNDLRIIAGQATAALELIEDTSDLDYIFAPVGGGGLLSGTALSVHYFAPKTKVIAGEPAGADDAFRSFKNGRFVPSENPNTIADGLLTSLGDITFPIIKKHVADIYTVKEDSIVRSMKNIWERNKIIVEPSSAVALAILEENKEAFNNKRIGIILSGGNVDLNSLPF